MPGQEGARFAARLLVAGRARLRPAVKSEARRAARTLSDMDGVSAEAKGNLVLVRGGFSGADDGRWRWPGAWVRELMR